MGSCAQLKRRNRFPFVRACTCRFQRSALKCDRVPLARGYALHRASCPHPTPPMPCFAFSMRLLNLCPKRKFTIVDFPARVGPQSKSTCLPTMDASWTTHDVLNKDISRLAHHHAELLNFWLNFRTPRVCVIRCMKRRHKLFARHR